jgi:hypothetical protein
LNDNGESKYPNFENTAICVIVKPSFHNAMSTCRVKLNIFNLQVTSLMQTLCHNSICREHCLDYLRWLRLSYCNIFEGVSLNFNEKIVTDLLLRVRDVD